MKKLCKLYDKPLRILRDLQGQTLVEYGLLLILIAIVVMTAVKMFGEETSAVYSTIITSLP